MRSLLGSPRLLPAPCVKPLRRPNRVTMLTTSQWVRKPRAGRRKAKGLGRRPGARPARPFPGPAGTAPAYEWPAPRVRAASVRDEVCAAQQPHPGRLWQSGAVWGTCGGVPAETRPRLGRRPANAGHPGDVSPSQHSPCGPSRSKDGTREAARDHMEIGSAVANFQYNSAQQRPWRRVKRNH